MASQYPKLSFSCITRLYFVLYTVDALQLSRGLYKSTLFLQNKPNLQKAKTNVISVLTRAYENIRLRRCGKTNPISMETNPIKPKLVPAKAGILHRKFTGLIIISGINNELFPIGLLTTYHEIRDTIYERRNRRLVLRN